MSINPDDPRFTAYALGELSDCEREEFEAFLAETPEAQELLNDITVFTADLGAELGGEDCAALLPEQRAAIDAALAEPAVAATSPKGGCSDGVSSPAPKPLLRRIFTPLRLTAAAVVMLAAGLYMLSPNSNLVSMSEPPPAAGELRYQPGVVPVPNDVQPQETVLQETGPGRSQDMESPDTSPPPSQPAPKPANWESLLYLDGHVRGAATREDDAVPRPATRVEETTTLDITGLVGDVDNSGYIDASGKAADQKRPVVIQGRSVTNAGVINVDAAGDANGGVIRPPGVTIKADDDTDADSVTVGSGIATVPVSTTTNGNITVTAGGDVSAVNDVTFSFDTGKAVDGTTISTNAVNAVTINADGAVYSETKRRNAPGAAVATGRYETNGALVDTTRPSPPNFNSGEAYQKLPTNPFHRVLRQPLSTFSIDVDTAGYANVRRFLQNGQRPPAAAVRVEEMVNYFDYEYPEPAAKDGPFSVNVEIAGCPWNPRHRLARVALKGRMGGVELEKPKNLVFLIDVSGSMSSQNKLPLLKQSMSLLTDNLSARDRVAIVVYAGASGVVLPSTSCENKGAIMQALDRLQSGGSTNGGAGIEQAYKIAQENFIKDGINRVILATDGDFNVGVTNRSDLISMVEQKAKGNVFLTVLGFGMGNLKDATLEQLADKGNGNYAYVDSFAEARKIFLTEMYATLVTIAKDVKIQVEFNPGRVQHYRLIGYENRMLKKEDFNDDTKDAGEIGAGHTVTAFYELVPMGVQVPPAKVDALRYQQPAGDVSATPAIAVPPALRGAPARETLTVKLRYKQPDGDTSTLKQVHVVDQERGYANASGEFKFAAAVAGFGMHLRGTPHVNMPLTSVEELAMEGARRDPHGYRAAFIDLVRRAKTLR